ncbi:glycoside hydrolase family 2 [Cohnella fermenti]|uniref:Glycoside hydrolase family 2 n=2 Tax=Cohnella fermenti TaxID=2565925 RepID=A0A4S4BQA3_9BACL|nr:glycoside hydrolase family 2 [Cohnella fermenti]
MKEQQSVTAERQEVILNGDWDFMPLYDEPQRRELPERLVYEERKVRVPSSWKSSFINARGKLFGAIPEHGYAPLDLYGYPQEWNDAEAGVLHRRFRVPAEMAGQRIVLRLDGVMEKAVIYLDGERIASWEDGYLPLRLDITERAVPGSEHELHVVIGRFDRVTIASGQQKITGLAGSWFSYVSRGIWQDVRLESCPKTALADVVIRTSVRQGTLEVLASVESVAERGPGRQRLAAVLRVRERGNAKDSEYILQAEAEAEEVSAEGDSPEGTNGRLCENDAAGLRTWQAVFRLDWKSAKLWSPDCPVLYEAELELRLDGERVDSRTETFGFREFWAEGPQFMLNGVPINLRGDSWHFQGALQMTDAYIRNWYRMCKEVGINSIRLHAEPYPSRYLDLADEEGMLIVDETAIYGSGKTMQADHPDYIANCTAHIRRLLRRDKNHPSVVMWSLQNEMRWVDGRDGFKLHMPGWIAMMKELDPTRLVIAEGDNRLLAKEATEVESRHYNIDGTVAQWDRSVPLVFGEHGGWWYICPQNASPYAGLSVYRGTDESALGLAEKERLFVEYARREGVSGISTFNFAHYFMRAMPDENVILTEGVSGTPIGRIPAYSLTLNNGLLPEEYPAYRPNPAFAVMAAAFKAATIIPREYNRSFYDDEPIVRRLDVYNDTLQARDAVVHCRIVQDGKLVHDETFRFRHEPAERRTVELRWTPDKTAGTLEGAVSGAACAAVAELAAVLTHDGERVHELTVRCKVYSSRLREEPVAVARPVAYVGGDSDYVLLRRLIPACERIAEPDIGKRSGGSLLIVGSGAADPDGSLERSLQRFVAAGGRLLLLEQRQLSLGKLALSRRSFMRAHAGSYAHPVLAGISDDDLMFWREASGEEGPDPIIGAAFFKPAAGNYTLLLECGAGDFGDGGDLWTPLLEYRSGAGLFLANQLDVMSHADRVPQAMLLLRNMLAYVGLPAAGGQDASRTAAFVAPGSEAERLLAGLKLAYEPLGRLGDAELEGRRLLVAEAARLREPGAAEAARRFAEAGGRVVVLPADKDDEEALGRLLGRPVKVDAHESYHLEADYSYPEVSGFSPVDLFGCDKVFLSPRDTMNRILASRRLEAEGTAALGVSVEGTAWQDYFVAGLTAEYSRLALVELNRKKARKPGTFLLKAELGRGSAICSQLLPDAGDDKLIRLYTALLRNLGAAFADGELEGVKGDAETAVEAIMALPCPPHVPLDEMRAYYADPEFSLNNLGEGLYGWMLKRERDPQDGRFRIPSPNGQPWLFSCFVYSPEAGRVGTLRAECNDPYELIWNGTPVALPGNRIVLREGINRLIVVVLCGEAPCSLGLFFHNADGTAMNDLEYRLTIGEVEPK